MPAEPSTSWNYCVTRRELLGMIFGVRKFCPYLAGVRFTIRTDHSASQMVGPGGWDIPQQRTVTP